MLCTPCARVTARSDGPSRLGVAEVLTGPYVIPEIPMIVESTSGMRHARVAISASCWVVSKVLPLWLVRDGVAGLDYTPTLYGYWCVQGRGVIVVVWASSLW